MYRRSALPSKDKAGTDQCGLLFTGRPPSNYRLTSSRVSVWRGRVEVYGCMCPSLSKGTLIIRVHFASVNPNHTLVQTAAGGPLRASVRREKKCRRRKGRLLLLQFLNCLAESLFPKRPFFLGRLHHRLTSVVANVKVSAMSNE